MESLSSFRGTPEPISISPSATGRVSSKTVALVKLRMEKESSHFRGQGIVRPASSYCTRILRANISRFKHKTELARSSGDVRTKDVRILWEGHLIVEGIDQSAGIGAVRGALRRSIAG